MNRPSPNRPSSLNRPPADRKHPGRTPIAPEAVIARRRRALRNRQDIRSFCFRLIFMALFVYVLFFRIFGIVTVPNDDMKPKLYGGDLALIYRLRQDWAAGDVIYYRKADESYIGRIIAAPGDTVDITPDGRVLVNGSALIEDEIFYANKLYEAGIDFPAVLESDAFFVLGDYREGAKDSRLFGPVAASEIEGKIISAIRRKGL